MSLQNAAAVKDRPGGILAGVLRFFTRELPRGLDAGAPPAPTGADADTNAALSHESGALQSSDAIPLALAQHVAGTLPVTDPVEVPMDRLSYLVPAPTPGSSERGADIALAA